MDRDGDFDYDQQVKLQQYPSEARVRANLQEWVRNIESYGLAKGAGQAFLDETADTDTADLPPAAAKAASQLWGMIKMSCSRDPVMVVVIETLQSGTPRRYLNGGTRGARCARVFGSAASGRMRV